jgi:hypothetical protein
VIDAIECPALSECSMKIAVRGGNDLDSVDMAVALAVGYLPKMGKTAKLMSSVAGDKAAIASRISGQYTFSPPRLAQRRSVEFTKDAGKLPAALSTAFTTTKRRVATPHYSGQ